MSPEEQAKLNKSMSSGKFDMDDFKVQLRESAKLGTIGMVKWLPGMKQYRQPRLLMRRRYKEVIEKAQSAVDKDQINMEIKLIEAMTEEERKDPDILTNKAFAAKTRIAKAAGGTVQDVNRLVC